MREEGVGIARTRLRNSAAGSLGDRFARYVEGRRAGDRESIKSIYRIRGREGDATRRRAPWKGTKGMGWGLDSPEPELSSRGPEGPSQERDRGRGREGE